MRISLNSARPDVYAAYYRPRHYDLSDVEASAQAMKRHGRHLSTNLLYFPGVTDTPAELEAFADFARRVDLDLVQVRNLNVDPELYREALPAGTVAEGMGVEAFMARLLELVPGIAFGYFNPTRERYEELAAARRLAAESR
jgi:pyruvate-formate lyase-activating enzyme